MLDLLKQFLLENVWILGQMAPYLSLGFFFAGLLYAFVPKQMVARHLGGETVGSAVRAAILGVPLPLCSCGVVPTGIGLRRRGASRAAVVSFLISTPQTGLDSIAATYGFFGWVFAVFRPVAAFISGIAGGIATLSLRDRSVSDEKLLRYQNRAEDALEQEQNGRSVLRRFLGGMRYAFVDLLGDIALWLIIGLAVASLISMLIPDGFFAENLHNSFLQMLVMMIVGIPLYVCSTASIPIAAVLMAKGISAGAAFVFLMTGPATNAATLIIVARVMGARVLAMYLGSIAVLALCFGLGLDFLTGHTALTVTTMVMEHDHHMLPGVITWGAALLLSYFLLSHFYESLKHRFARINMAAADNALDLVVEGMNCSHCVRTVTESLKSVPGVNAVNVTLENGLAHVEGENLDHDTLTKAVTGVGYKVRDSR